MIVWWTLVCAYRHKRKQSESNQSIDFLKKVDLIMATTPYNIGKKKIFKMFSLI